MKRGVLSMLLVLLAPSVALADPPKAGSDPAAAQTLFYDARNLMAQGKFAEACPKLEESLRLDQGLGTQFNLAECNERLGKTATAWAGFLEVAAEAKTANQPDRERLARKRAQALEGRLPKLVVEVPAPTPGLEVKRDGVVLGAAAWGSVIPVDSGPHRIVASALGKQWETSVQAHEGKIARVTVPRDLPAAPAGAPAIAAAPVGPAPVASATVTAAPLDGAADFPPPVVESSGATQRAIGWVVAGAGVVGLGVGGGFGLSSIKKRDESRSHCVVDQCDSDGVGLRDDALRNGNIATIVTIAGGAAVAGGLILVLTAPKDTHPRAGKLRAIPTASLGGGGFMLQGNFQ